MDVRLGAPPSTAVLPDLDESQEAAVARAVSGPGNLLIVGRPGSGKTTVTAAIAARTVNMGVDPERLLVLAPTRSSAADLRDVVSAAMNRPTGVPVVRTAASVGHAILSARARMRDEPEPALVTGAEQDAILKDLLDGHRAGLVPGPDWSGVVPEDATALPGFRAELRDIVMRASEAGAGPQKLRELSEQTARPEWKAVAQVVEEYLSVLDQRAHPGDQGLKYDPASASREAAAALDAAPATGGPMPEWDLVIVDDYQDATSATIALVDAVRRRGARVVLVGNADESVQGYRGAVPSALADARGDAGDRGFTADVVTLEHDHRQAPGLSAVTDAVIQHIGTQGVGSPRQAPGSALGAPVEIAVAPHRYAQSRAVAAALRRARTAGRADGDPRPWSSMAVMARSNSQLRELRADLRGADIPCDSLGDGVALHQQSAIAPLITMLRVALGEPWTEESAEFVLTSRLIGVDAIGMRRLRRALVREERSGGGHRPASELLVEAMEAPERWASIDEEPARRAGVAVQAVEAARALIAADASPRRVIWSVWTAVDVAESWRSAALAGSVRDDADLDAVIAFMRVAQNHEERMGAGRVGAFLDYVTSQNFEMDSLGARATGVDSVALVTPASAAGREWDVAVIAGVEEGTWPNVRLRDSVLGAQHLAQLLNHRADPHPLTPELRTQLAHQSRRDVIDDETRAFAVAVSRAREQVIVTCVQDEESRASRFVEWVSRASGVDPVDAGTSPAVGDLRHAVATLRARGTASDGEDRSGYAMSLARLATRGIAGASPRQWHGAIDLSTEDGFFAEQDVVRVSPSKVEGVERCALRWALEAVGGVGQDSEKQNLGTLIHEIAAELPQGSHEELLEALDVRWSEIAGTETLPDKALRTKAEEMIRRLAAYIATHPVMGLAVEQGFRVQIDRAVLSGSADRVEQTDEGTVVVDLKTGSPSYAGEVETHAQLSMYQLAAAHGAFDGIDHVDGAALAFVGGSNVKPTVVKQDAIDVDEQKARLADVVTTMSGRQFLAVENDMCSMCPVRSACPVQVEGRQVSEG